MQELTDDQLDGLFRKSAEEFDTPYDPSGWEAMKDQLDDRDRAAFWKRLLPWGIPLLLLLLIGGTWYAYQTVHPATTKDVSRLATKKQPTVADNSRITSLSNNRKNENDPVPVASSQLIVSPSGNSSLKTGNIVDNQVIVPGKISAERTKSVKNPDKSEAGMSINTASSATKRLVGTYRRKTENWRRSVVARNTLTNSNHLPTTTRQYSRRLHTDESNLTSRVNKTSSAGKRTFTTAPVSAHTNRSTGSFAKKMAGNSVGQVPFSESNTPGLAMPATVVLSETADHEPFVFSDIAELAIRPGKWAKLPALANREVTQPEQTESVSVPAAQLSRGFSVRFAVSPDLSSIGLTNFSRPGTNVGVFLEYRMASRWSVQAGVIRSTKVYGATAYQYSSDTYGGTMPYTKPDRIDGVCNMLDIPINVRYDIVLRSRLDTRLQPSRWFVNGGVTSYIMLKEEYTFTYPPHTYNVPTGRSENTGAYGFSQLNLSVGYERALSRRLSWQAEPFIKVPLKGVGFYKVNLLSTGAFLSLRYKL